MVTIVRPQSHIIFVLLLLSMEIRCDVITCISCKLQTLYVMFIYLFFFVITCIYYSRFLYQSSPHGIAIISLCMRPATALIIFIQVSLHNLQKYLDK